MYDSYTEEHKKACQLLTSRHEWGIVENLLREFLDSLKDLTTLDEKELGQDKNIVFLSRLKAHERLEAFLNAVNLLGKTNQKVDDKDFFE